jgi:poly-beta-1,6-N-acetyl-D-glucosamine synthase
MQRLAVLLPCFNEELVIRQTIGSILATDLPKENVFVINDCSTDGSAEIARSLGVNVTTNPTNIGKTRGIESTIQRLSLKDRFEFISILDADTTINRDYFQHVLESFLDPNVAGVCGQAMSTPRNWLTAYRAFEYALVHTVYKKAQSRMGVINISAGCATTYRSEVIAQIEWHPHEIMIEDADITPQIHRKKLGRIIYNEKAVVHTQDPDTIKTYSKQCRRWYTGIWQAWRVYGIPFGKQRIDFESLFLGGETFISSLFILLTPVWYLVTPYWTIRAIVLGLVINFLMSLYFSVKLKRLDILVFSPSFVIPRTINRIMYLISFWDAIILQKKSSGVWVKPDRYPSMKKRKVSWISVDK